MGSTQCASFVEPVDGVYSTWNFRLGGLAERAKVTPVCSTLYGDKQLSVIKTNGHPAAHSYWKLERAK